MPEGGTGIEKEVRKNDRSRRDRLDLDSNCVAPAGSDNPSRSGNSDPSVPAVPTLRTPLDMGAPAGDSLDPRTPADNIPLKERKEVRNREQKIEELKEKVDSIAEGLDAAKATALGQAASRRKSANSTE